MRENGSQDVEKETIAQSDIHLPSSLRSPGTRFGPPRAQSVPPPAQGSRPSSPDFVTQLGQYSATVVAAANILSCLTSSDALQSPAVYMCRSNHLPRGWL